MSSLAATQADGYYRDPDGDGSRKKAKVADKGVVRFELPFDGICLSCSVRASKGTRFNARKEKAGNYFSTTIYSFLMSCPSCKSIFEIKTDPKNCTYEYVSGIRLQVHDFVPDEGDHHQSVVSSQCGTLGLAVSDPMEFMEKEVEQSNRIRSQREQLEALISQNLRKEKDFQANSALRAKNREKKRKLQEAYSEGALRGLTLPLLESIDPKYGRGEI